MSEWTVQIETVLSVPAPSDIDVGRLLSVLDRDGSVAAPVVGVDASSGVISARFQVEAPSMYEAATAGVVTFGGALDLARLSRLLGKLLVEVVPVSDPT
ncbi:MAG: hypothetical protein QOJ13_3407 [Gaiellales bacterium]|jgi:hypothetical protein|nr:hypothetical protein [Gaiellales bacterium]